MGRSYGGWVIGVKKGAGAAPGRAESGKSGAPAPRGNYQEGGNHRAGLLLLGIGVNGLLFRRRLIAGAVAVAAGIAGATSSDGNARAASNVAIIGGGYLLKSGLEKRNEAQIHVQAMEELGMSLEAEITPQVIELEDRSVTLKGNVEDQYAQWRSLLADIYAAEIGGLEAPGESSGAADTL